MTIAHPTSNEPLCVDLCCGLGGWADGFLAEGYRVIGLDIAPQPEYPGQFVLADVKAVAAALTELGELTSWYGLMRKAIVIVASPPCEEFSRHQMPWTKRRNPPPPDLSVVDACKSIASVLGKPSVMENVRKAQDWLGKAMWHAGSYYLWGDVPALMPTVAHRNKESMSSTARLERARVPLDLARHIARVFYPGCGKAAGVA